jgi:hypothetical protein
LTPSLVCGMSFEVAAARRAAASEVAPGTRADVAFVDQASDWGAAWALGEGLIGPEGTARAAGAMSTGRQATTSEGKVRTHPG